LKSIKKLPEFLKGFFSTIKIVGSPNPGGLNPFFVGTNMNYQYNSIPFGVCSDLNSMGAQMISNKYGYPYRYYWSSVHTITEMKIKNNWYVMDSFSGDLFTDPDPGSKVPLYTLKELAHHSSKDMNKKVWDSPEKLAQSSLFDNVDFVKGESYTFKRWRFPEISLRKGESIVIEPSGMTSGDILETGSFEMNSYPYFKSYRANHAVITQPLKNLRKRNNVNHPFWIYDVSLQVKLPVKDHSFYSKNNIRELTQKGKLKVIPVAPKGTMALRELYLRGNEDPPNKNSRKHAKLELKDWKIINGQVKEYGNKLLISTGASKKAQIRLKTGYTNKTDQVQYVWMPFVYRTETPTSRFKTDIIGYFGVLPHQGYRIISFNRELNYSDLIFILEPGKNLTVDFVLNPEKEIEIYSLGQPIDVSDIVSHRNPVMAAQLDIEDMDPKWDDKILVSYKLLVNSNFCPQWHPAPGKKINHPKNALKN